MSWLPGVGIPRQSHTLNVPLWVFSLKGERIISVGRLNRPRKPPLLDTNSPYKYLISKGSSGQGGDFGVQSTRLFDPFFYDYDYTYTLGCKRV